LAKLATDRFGGVHLLRSNAGVQRRGAALGAHGCRLAVGIRRQRVRRGLEHQGVRAAHARAGRGSHLNTASAAGWLNGPGGGIYNASKHAVVSMSENLVFNLKDAGARTASASPSCVRRTSHADRRCGAKSARRARRHASLDRGEAAAPRASALRRKHGRISAAEIAETTPTAVKNDQFYVFPHKEDQNGGGRRGGVDGDARAGKPRCSRIFGALARSRMAAIWRSRPPQQGHASMSKSNVARISSDHVSRSARVRVSVAATAPR
jgi:hypothetical protein